MAELEDWRIRLGLFPATWEQLGHSSGAALAWFSEFGIYVATLLLNVGCGWSLREKLVEAILPGGRLRMGTLSNESFASHFSVAVTLAQRLSSPNIPWLFRA